MLHEYETIVIIRPELDDALIRGIVEKMEGTLTDNGGHILDRDDWGKRKLAYNIVKQVKGHYIRVHFAAPPSVVSEFERRIRIDDQIIRFMTVRLNADVDLVQRQEAAATARKTREEEAKRRAEAEPDMPLDYEEDDDDMMDA